MDKLAQETDLAMVTRADETPKPVNHTSVPSEDIIDEVLNVAGRAGIDLDRRAARAWLQAVSVAIATPGEFSRTTSGEFGGHELALIDFDPSAAARLRRIGRLIATPRADGMRAALAIAGSAAQGRIQPFPADADLFERLHFDAPDRETAIAALAGALRRNIEQTNARPELRFEEVHFGRRAGIALCWLPDEFVAGWIERRTAHDAAIRLSWEAAAGDPGFVKIDWTLLDPELGGPGKVSKAIDATWQRPDGSIASLDGVIDTDFQQIYLDADLPVGRVDASGGRDTDRGLARGNRSRGRAIGQHRLRARFARLSAHLVADRRDPGQARDRGAVSGTVLRHASRPPEDDAPSPGGERLSRRRRFRVFAGGVRGARHSGFRRSRCRRWKWPVGDSWPGLCLRVSRAI